MIKFKKRPTPPKDLPEEAEIKQFFNSKVLVRGNDARMYKLTYQQLLEYYEVER
jgi:hypothetical protein